MSAPGTKRVRQELSPETRFHDSVLESKIMDTTEASVMALKKAKQKRASTSIRQVSEL